MKTCAALLLVIDSGCRVIFSNRAFQLLVFSQDNTELKPRENLLTRAPSQLAKAASSRKLPHTNRHDRLRIEASVTV